MFSLVAIASCQSSSSVASSANATPIDVCDDRTSIDEKLIVVEGYIWPGIPAIWSPHCPHNPLPTLVSTNPSASDQIDEAMFAATQNREAEMVVQADYFGTISTNEHGGEEISISRIENVRLIPHPNNE